MTESDAPLSLKNQLVLVTGGAKRIGRAISIELASRGAQVAVHCRTSIAEAQELCVALGGGSFVCQADLSRADEIHEMMSTVRRQSVSGSIDMLVNNAARFSETPLGEMTVAQWNEELSVNLTAPLVCMQAAVAAGCKSIVNLVDIAAWQPWLRYAAYGVSKAGLLQLTKIAAREWAPGVRVNAVAPGTILFHGDFSEERQHELLRKIPLKKFGSDTDVARAVFFLLTERYLTGVCLPVDGGQAL